jgi:ElaB/YqjD/DUF883 family membrane-anchored ribosome-binding protein
MRKYIVIALLGLLMVGGQALAKESKAHAQEKAPMSVEKAKEQVKAPEAATIQSKDKAAVQAADSFDDDAQETFTQK